VVAVSLAIGRFPADVSLTPPGCPGSRSVGVFGNWDPTAEHEKESRAASGGRPGSKTTLTSEHRKRPPLAAIAKGSLSGGGFAARASGSAMPVRAVYTQCRRWASEPWFLFCSDAWAEFTIYSAQYTEHRIKYTVYDIHSTQNIAGCRWITRCPKVKGIC
jgi:hypothetical protein